MAQSSATNIAVRLVYQSRFTCVPALLYESQWSYSLSLRGSSNIYIPSSAAAAAAAAANDDVVMMMMYGMRLWNDRNMIFA